jgi:hypothetical protein
MGLADMAGVAINPHSYAIFLAPAALSMVATVDLLRRKPEATNFAARHERK